MQVLGEMRRVAIGERRARRHRAFFDGARFDPHLIEDEVALEIEVDPDRSALPRVAAVLDRVTCDAAPREERPSKVGIRQRDRSAARRLDDRATRIARGLGALGVAWPLASESSSPQLVNALTIDRMNTVSRPHDRLMISA
jgi:hypothetical protein